MAELCKTWPNEYDVLVDGGVIGRVWDWHGSWSAKAGDKVHRNFKSRKDAFSKVELSISR